MNQGNGNQLPVTPAGKPENKRSKRPVFLIILVAVLSVIMGYMIYENRELYQVYEESQEDKAELERIKSNLETELMSIYQQYDSLKTENDTINLMLMAEQSKIEQLLKVTANSRYKINLYEKELETIRQVLRSYVVQIDSLNQANIALRSENIEVKQELRKSQRETESLAKQTEELTEKVELASVLSAKDISAVGLNRRNNEKDKIKSIEKLRVCFTLRENSVIPAEEKTVHIRIARPDEVILTAGMNFFDFEGEQIICTASREVDYQNTDVDLCIFWTNDGQLIPGTYQLNIFTDGNNIGSSSFTLK